MKKNRPNHFTADEFRTKGYEIINLIADYMQEVESYPVLSQIKPGELYSKLPSSPPQQGENFDAVVNDVKEHIIPGLTHWQSPNFFAYFPSNSSGPSVLGDLLSSGFGIQGMLWSTSPACTELETLVLDWMVEIAGLPKHFNSSQSGGGVIQESASAAALCAAVAARERAMGKSESFQISNLTAYITDHTHSSAEKSLKIAGFRDEQIRRINVKDKFQMDTEHLSDEIQKDLAIGKIPTCTCATIGTTSSLALDPIPKIAKICSAHDIWLHVDGAYAGNATVCPEFRYLIDGLEHVDSYCFNPHKWLLTNFDCDLFYVAKKSELVNALTFVPEYLKNKATDSGLVFDYSGWQISLGRRFRSLKLWLVIRHYGVEGLQAHIRSHIELAEIFTRWVEEDLEFELFQPTVLNLVCFAHKDGNEKTKDVLDRLNASGKAYMTHTILNGTYVIRFVPGSASTEMRHIKSAWKALKDAV